MLSVKNCAGMIRKSEHNLTCWSYDCKIINDFFIFGCETHTNVRINSLKAFSHWPANKCRADLR